MIPTRRLKEICECFPKAKISNPNFYSSFIFDEAGNIIGWIDFQTGNFTIDEKYSHFELVQKILRKNNVELKSKPIDLTDLIYGNPKKENDKNDTKSSK